MALIESLWSGGRLSFCFQRLIVSSIFSALILMGHLVLFLLWGEDFLSLLSLGAEFFLYHHFETERQVCKVTCLVTYLVTRLDLPKVR